MYILLNRDNMTLLYKHECPRTLANLAWIETRFASSYIFPVWDATDFTKFTDLELKMLYRSLTKSKDEIHVTRLQLIQIIWDQVNDAKPTIAKRDEAQSQADHIADNSKILYKYVYGSHRPALMKELFEPTPIHGERNMAQEQSAIAGRIPSLKRVPAAKIASTVAKMKNSSTINPKPAKNAPKAGSAKSIIWNTADAMWEQAGKPKEQPVVLALRKEIMNKLEEEEGIKRTSASSELGQWNKARITCVK